MPSDRTTSSSSREISAREELTALLAQAESKRVEFSKLLPSTISWDVFKDTFKVAIQQNPKLLAANRQSLWIALQRAALDGLMPDGREGAMVIFNEDEEDGTSRGNRPKMVVWMPMIRGLIKLARATGDVAVIRASLVYKGEELVISDEDGQLSYRHERRVGPDFDDSDANIVAALGVIVFKDGTWDMEVMSRTQIERVKAVSRAKKGPWLPWYGEMAKKTVLRRLLKRQPTATAARIEAALDRDETMGTTIEGNLEDPNVLTMQDARREPPQEEPEPIRPTERSSPPASPPPAAPPAFEVWATDEIGEPVDAPAFSTPMAFAEWFEAAAEKTSNIEALRENNMDAIADAGADPEAALVISHAIQIAMTRLAAPAAPEASPNVPASQQTLAVPMTAAGAPHWGRYLAAAEKVIATFQTAAEADEWLAYNRPTFAGKAVEPKINALLAGRATPDAGPDKDAEWVQAAERDLEAMSGWDDVLIWSRNAAVKATVERLKAGRPALADQLRAFIERRGQALRNTTGTGA